MSGVPSEGARFRLHSGGRYIDVVGLFFVIGRQMGCQLRLEEDLVSRRHARLVETDRGLWVEDLKSLNGVYVNSRRIEAPTLLSHGDLLTIGRTTFDVVDLRQNPSLGDLRAEGMTPTSKLPYDVSDITGPEPRTMVPRVSQLSDREQEVLMLVLRGLTQSEIAKKLFISVKTVESHKAHISEKLGCRSRSELVAYAISAGILRFPAP